MKFIANIFFPFYFLSTFGFTQVTNFIVPNQIPYTNPIIMHWADSVLNTLSLNQKIGQLFMVTATGRGLSENYYKEIFNKEIKM